ncbi:hypothetical protein [Agromyces sp. SYSU T00194]|uniref:hypothetical protein n=1 Tax=Agromyces chitinivorans TaxID=3158560 RepID=UPI003396E8E3
MRPAFGATRGVERPGWITVVGLLVLPVLVAVLLAWALSAPAKHLDRVTAAIVNDDDPVTVNGQTVPLGREFAANLIGGDAGEGAPDDPGADATATPAPTGPNFGWVLTNDTDAATGLAEGTYAAVVTIPPSFSADATSISGPASDAVQASLTVETTPATAYLDPALTAVLVQEAVATLNRELTQRYLSNVYEGFNQLNASIGQAADGAAQLADGAASLASGSDELAAGAEQLASGLDALDAGAESLSAGLAQLDASVQPLPAETAQLAAGSAQVAAAVDAGSAALARATDEFATIVSDVCALPGPGTVCSRATAALGRLQAANQDVAALAAGADQVAAGNQQLANGIPGLVAGVDSASAGANEVAAGAGESAEGGASVASGAEGVASGAGELDSGAAQLADGLAEAVEQIPTYTDDDISTLSAVVAQPVTASLDLPASGTQSVPLFAVVALWVGGLVLALAARAVPGRALLGPDSSFRLLVRGARPVVGLGAAQGAVVGVTLMGFLSVDPAFWLLFVAACTYLGVVFALVNHGLAAAFDGVGRTLAALVAVVALVVGTSSTVPDPLEALAAFLPTGPADALLLAAIDVGSGWGPIVALLVWALVGAGLALAGIVRRRSGESALEAARAD